MSISKKLDETLSSLDLDSSAQELKDRVISKSMNNLKEKMSGMDIEVERQTVKFEVEPHKDIYEKLELADVAREVYRENICPRDEKTEEERHAGEAKPVTIASRANMKALSRSLAGLRSSGNDGKVSPVGPNGTGNLGKTSPTGENGSGNIGTNGQYGNYYALTTDMTLEEYESYVHSIFEGEDCAHEKDKKVKKIAKQLDAAVKMHGDQAKTLRKAGIGEDVVYELEQKLVTLGSTDWIQVDQVLRETAREYDVAPRTISREFKSVHGLYPDKWIKEHLNVEMCGYMPLEEAARMNKVGTVYEVTFMFRGGTNRLKFFWPMPGEASKEDMQREVEKFWPKARLIAHYPTIDNEMQSNYMVMAPPVTENYHFMQPDEWTEISEEASEILKTIYEEEGEPISPIYLEEEGYCVTIEDHDTGEERQVIFSEGGLHAWFSKSKSKDGKGGWVQSDGSPCARKKGQTSAPKCYSSQRLAALKRTPKGKKLIRSADARKKREDAGQSSKRGAAKPTYVSTFKDPKDKKKYKSGDQTLKDESFDPTLDEATAMAKRGYDEAPIRRKIASQTGGGAAADRATALAGKETFGRRGTDPAARDRLARKQRTDFRQTTSSSPGLRGYAYKSDDPKVKEKQAARGQQRGVLTPNEKAKFNEENMDEACWAGYTKKGMKTMFGKRYPNCVKKTKKEETEMLNHLTHDLVQQSVVNLSDSFTEGKVSYKCKKCKDKGCDECRGKLEEGKTPAWQRKEGKNPSGGLNAKGVASYRAANPGSKLKTAVTTKPSKLKKGSKAANRRKSFCSRMKGMKKKLTSAKTANDPDSRINKSLRKWNC